MFYIETIASLQAFRKRHGDAQRLHGQLSSQPTTIDINHYRSVLKNKAIVDEAEKILKEYKPITYDVGAHIKAIESFETKAVRPFYQAVVICRPTFICFRSLPQKRQNERLMRS